MQQSPMSPDLTDTSEKIEQPPSPDEREPRSKLLTEEERAYLDALAEVRRNFVSRDRKNKR